MATDKLKIKNLEISFESTDDPNLVRMVIRADYPITRALVDAMAANYLAREYGADWAEQFAAKWKAAEPAGGDGLPAVSIVRTASTLADNEQLERERADYFDMGPSGMPADETD